MKVVIRGKLIVETAHLKETYRAFSGRLRELEREYQNTKDIKTDQEIKDK